jgi:prepilin-type N-terminal cleavage/methylation domain-containing protein
MNQHFYAQTDSRYLQNLQTRQAFTLVELIVVIAILAILGTIGFVSIQGYSSRSRDSVRVTALNNTITALEIAQTRSGRYPIPDNSFQVTYSGATVWTQ